MVGSRIQVRGIVQGVGFRPFVYTLAARLNLTGWVRNTSSGVDIELNGSPEAVQSFLDELHNSPPPLSRIDQVTVEPCDPNGYMSFEILMSQPQEGDFIPISPDVSICTDCQRELFNPSDRRYHYPFINCTNCGPRFTIIRDIPYDRPKTTMADFLLCPDCASEYHNPLDRRFHAQPVACKECGPHLWFEAGGEKLSDREDALQMARQWIQEGKILAIKGLGGFHLACDAANAMAVNELRRRKKRSDKAFALMAFDRAAVERHCMLTPDEAQLLESRQRPIVLLEKRIESNAAPGIAPGQNTLGMMLPYTPLHLLLLEPAPGYPDLLVMTSGNMSEEPIAYSDEDARARLANLADAFLMHNRPIHVRVDDSIARVLAGSPVLLRRARGYAPNSVPLPRYLPSILGAGAELKNTFCLTRDNYAFVSHHIGDMENYETLRSFEEGVAHYKKLFRIQPEIIAADLHPDYLATRYARELADREHLTFVSVQHHHAHLAACLADNGWDTLEPVIGLSFDGTGMGLDGAIWGSEVLLGGYAGFTRKAHLRYVPLAGGDASVRKPARMALAHLWAAGLDWEADLPPVVALCAEERTALRVQLERGFNTLPTSSMGRLFDAASALLGVRSIATYEGQAAVEMEAILDPYECGRYPLDIQAGEINPARLWSALMNDWRAGVSVAICAARFHNTISAAVLEICEQIRSETSINTIALSGGVWQNRTLYTNTLKSLQNAKFRVLVHRQLPTNDGCIALGQVLVAAAQTGVWNR